MIEYQYREKLHPSEVEKHLPHLVFPNIFGKRWNTHLSGVLATYKRQPVGLILSLSSKQEKRTQILSFKVRKEIRNNGIGFQLMKRLEEEKLDHQLELYFRDNWEHKGALEKTLNRRSWEGPALHLTIYNYNCTQLHDLFPEAENAISNHGYTIQHFDKENQELTSALEAFVQGNNLDLSMSPLVNTSSILAEVSLLLYHGSRIAGWIIGHGNNKSVEFTTLYLAENHRKYKLGIGLMKQAILFQSELKIPKTRFLVRAKNKVMQGFADRLSGQVSSTKTGVYKCWKT